VVNQTLARRYAIAIVTLAREQDAVRRVGADLVTMSKAIGEDGLVRDFFVAPIIERATKERVLREAFEGRVHPIALHTLLLLVRKRREALLDAIVTQYLALEREARGVETLTLQSARALDREERLRLVSRLELLYRKKFEVTEVVDPQLIGGLRIMMGDRRIDATISGRLNALARELAQTA
jgi:F-type H+-transporting ATPase subunit delta